MTKTEATDWINNLPKQCGTFLDSIAHSRTPGRYYPCKNGMSRKAKRIALSFSCFALKARFTLNKQDESSYSAWASFIQSFQLSSNKNSPAAYQKAFVDPILERELGEPASGWRTLLRKSVTQNPNQKQIESAYAESKQAISSLSMIGHQSLFPYYPYSSNPDKLKQFLLSLDWTKPWGAGGQAAVPCVLINTEGPRLFDQPHLDQLKKACCSVYDELADANTGAYFSKNTPPSHGELINGAMKAITGMTWLDLPIHYPDSLINSCLSAKPKSDGCDLVDIIYVLYECLKQSNHRRREIEGYCIDILEMIQQHQQPDGGFSYKKEGSRKKFQSIKLSDGSPQGDIHGTCLLLWAIAMISKILEAPTTTGWNVIRP